MIPPGYADRFCNEKKMILKLCLFKWKMYTERLEQGKWNPGIVSRDIPNLCPVLKMPSEPWYQYTKHLENLHCPINAGVSENHLRHITSK